MTTRLNSPQFVSEVQSLVNGTVPSSDNSSIDTGLVAWNKLKTILDESTTANQVFSNAIISTYSIVYTTSSAYIGGVLNANGDIHFIPFMANTGQRISITGVVSTYSLVYSTGGPAYAGGVLAPNGDINFVPYNAAVGQKLNSSGVVSTYSLVYTATAAYNGGVLGTNGDTHFIPLSANRGQKISSTGVVSTYSLVYTTSLAYIGGVLAPNGDINFIPFDATVGQKISSAGVVSTYSLVYTVSAGGGATFTSFNSAWNAIGFTGSGTSGSPYTKASFTNNPAADGAQATVTSTGNVRITCSNLSCDVDFVIYKNGVASVTYADNSGGNGFQLGVVNATISVNANDTIRLGTAGSDFISWGSALNIWYQ